MGHEEQSGHAGIIVLGAEGSELAIQDVSVVSNHPRPSPPPGASALFQSLSPKLSSERLKPYLMAANGNQKKAIQLYQWNVALSGSVYEALHVFEVVLRNAIDKQLCEWNSTQLSSVTGSAHHKDWLLDPSKLLLRLAGETDLAKAAERAKKAVRGRRSPLHADVLAQVTFGTWRFLLPDKDAGRQLIWNEALVKAFPYMKRKEAEMVASVSRIYGLRNRVAHLESLLDIVRVREQYEDMQMVLGEIDPGVQQWFVSTQRITPAIKLRP